jgi:hypothetical protein
MVRGIAQIDHHRMDPLNSRARLHGAAQACLLIVALLLTGSAAAACTGDHASTPSHTASATMSSMNNAQAAAWAVRPAYTHTTARTEEAYRYAMEHQAVLQWIPCFCGCGAMGHGNNLDCYFEPSASGSVVFEEHASYCVVCVDITLRTKQLAASGASLSTIRTTIDAEFGGIGPGTDTERPVS